MLVAEQVREAIREFATRTEQRRADRRQQPQVVEVVLHAFAQLVEALRGGGRIGASRTDVGQWNIDFVRKFLTDEGLDAIVEDLGGRNPRKVLYFAKTGKLRVLKIRELHNDTLQRREQTYEARLKTSGSQGGDVELF